MSEPRVSAVTPPRHDDFKRQVSSRNVLLSYVFGPKGCGKSCFINRLIKKGEIEISPETDRHICINKIRYDLHHDDFTISTLSLWDLGLLDLVLNMNHSKYCTFNQSS